MMTSAIDKLPEATQATILRMALTHERAEIRAWLAEQGYTITRQMLSHHLKKHELTDDRVWWIDPADTLDGRLRQYVTALIKHESSEFRLWDLDLRGQIWTTCSRALMRDGAIEKMPDRRRWYRIVKSDAKLREMKKAIGNSNE